MGMALWTIGYQNVTAVQGSMGSYIMIVISYILQDVFFGDKLDALGAVGVLLICSSCALHASWSLTAEAKGIDENSAFSTEEQQRLFNSNKDTSSQAAEATLWLEDDL
jgi:hypothetical protein